MKSLRSAQPSSVPNPDVSPSRGRGRKDVARPTGRSSVEPLECRQLLTTLPTGFAEERIGTFAFSSPTSMAIAPDGRMFVAEQSGELKVVKDGQLLATPFVAVPTTSENERGLLGVALDPNFATNGYVYVTYTATEGIIHNRLSRFTASGDVAVPGSETILYETGSMTVSIHNGGAIHFGPDGKLYMTVGENGGGPAAQQLTSHKGKLMRLNPDGTIPTDNPFYNQAAGDLRAIYALGFRNPFTFAFQPGTGTLYVNDVGTATWEEINHVTPGGNYGYPEVEGQAPDPRFTQPVYVYGHDNGCAIVGGAFYNPATATFPADYVGDYFFGDLCSRQIRRFDPGTGQATVFAQFTRGRVVDLDVTPDGSLYYLLRTDGNIYPGGIFRAVSTGQNTGAPVISEHPQSKVGSLGQPVTFTVSASGTEPLSYQWQRNGQNIAGANASSYTIPSVTAGDNGAQFRVVISNGAGTVTSNAATLTVSNNQPPVPTITSPAAGTLFSAGDVINFTGVGTDPEDGNLPAGAFTWRVDLMHADTPENEHAHPAMPATSGITGGTFTPDLGGHYESSIWLRVFLTVRDSDGVEATTFTDVQPRKSTMTFAASAPGLKIVLDGTPVRTPAPVVGVAGVQRTLSAPATQTVNGVTYEFVSWSDGGGADHAVATPATDAAFTANYRALDDGSANPPDSPDLTAAFVQPLAALALAGSTSRTRVRLTNSGATPVAGAAAVGLYLSTDPYLDPEDPPVATLPRNLRIGPGRSRVVTLPFTFPDTLAAGSYHLIAWADSGKGVSETNEANNVAVSAAPVAVGPPTRDFSATFSNVAVVPGALQRGFATLLLRYDGNVPANGPLGIELRASADPAADGADPVLATITRRVRMKPGTSKLLRVRFLPAGLGAGAYYVTAAVDTANAFAETSESNNTVVSGTTIAVA